MAQQSAGILLYRKAGSSYEVLLVHPGGPFWAKKDKNAWSIPKGEFEADETPLVAAKREFTEETGLPAPDGDYMMLAPARQSSGKIVHAFALEGDADLAQFKSNSFSMEWPPKSGGQQSFPENDKAEWVPLAAAAAKLVPGQAPFVEQLAALLGLGSVGTMGADDTQISLF